jgi:hypothetical protein
MYVSRNFPPQFFLQNLELVVRINKLVFIGHADLYLHVNTRWTTTLNNTIFIVCLTTNPCLGVQMAKKIGCAGKNWWL